MACSQHCGSHVLGLSSLYVWNDNDLISLLTTYLVFVDQIAQTAKMEARQVTATCIWPSQSTGTGGRTSILATANIASSPRTVTISTQTVSTHLGSRDTPTTTLPTTTATLPFCTPPPAPQTHYGQCGGQGYAGATVCTSTFTCSPIAPTYYSQCL
ncbi:hypothetical protein SISSUDRAFT_1059083 [Sistotremastrum suecicum HHB10207 ss-3]|uniref:CBM1 domain-containing protein n=1 Tax=Sistotremastrum suecicum HHB10207 ss-3 TaxID=1314776 RepID=A0A166GKD1_9AGAM|nr:hypothetical protein SISSUDRAFT_1059083 [Sistotremastrum suecicum HHB10207 ss-3]